MPVESSQPPQGGTPAPNGVRGILVGIGLLLILVNGAFVAMAESLVDREIAQLAKTPDAVDPAALPGLRAAAIRSARLFQGAEAVVGVAILALGLAAPRGPAAAALAGLVLYVGFTAACGVLNPLTLIRTWFLKVIVAYGLIRAVNLAVAFETDRAAPG